MTGLYNLPLFYGCAIHRNSVSISISNNYENTVIEIKTIIAPHSAPFPAVLFYSSIKGQFHVQISKIM